MTKINKYGFIFIGPGYKNEKVNMNSPFFEATIIAVSSIDEGCNMAKKMVESGVQVIELCGGFEDDGAKKVIDSINSKIPVGYVKFDSNEERKLKILLENLNIENDK